MWQWSYSSPFLTSVLGKQPPLPIWWAPEPVCTLWNGEKSLASAGNGTLAFHFVALLYTDWAMTRVNMQGILLSVHEHGLPVFVAIQTASSWDIAAMKRFLRTIRPNLTGEESILPLHRRSQNKPQRSERLQGIRLHLDRGTRQAILPLHHIFMVCCLSSGTSSSLL
jgi:hypothetical protein